MTRAFHFWSGEGRGDEGGHNLYENFAEATSGKGTVLPESGVNFASDVQDMQDEAAEEEAKDKEIKAELAKDVLRRRIGSMGAGTDGTRSAPSEPQVPIVPPGVDGERGRARLASSRQMEVFTAEEDEEEEERGASTPAGTTSMISAQQLQASV